MHQLVDNQDRNFNSVDRHQPASVTPLEHGIMVYQDAQVQQQSERPSIMMEGGNISLQAKNKTHLLAQSNKKQKHLSNASVFSITQKLRKDILSDLKAKGAIKDRSPTRRITEKNVGQVLKDYLLRIKPNLAANEFVVDKIDLYLATSLSQQLTRPEWLTVIQALKLQEGGTLPRDVETALDIILSDGSEAITTSQERKARVKKVYRK